MAANGDHRTVAVAPIGQSNGQDELVAHLRSQLSSLRIRLEELERENKRLVSLSWTCQCSNKVEGGNSLQVKSLSLIDITKIENKCNILSPERSMSDHHPIKTIKACSKRYIALKIMYYGQRYFGFASEATKEPTVESEIFKALERTRILIGDRKESNYSRCGRTDRGVSSTGQVISLFVRSNLKDDNACIITTNSEEKREIDYVRVLNRVLPSDIRVIGWCPVATDFHARFSCLYREYKYMFWKGNLDIEKMQDGAKRLIGEHDYRNFCKMDAANVSNYRRHITSFNIFSTNQRSSDDELWEIRISGSAFLWHQVRCMVAVLFMIGQGLESPFIIDTLLDTNKTTKKPQYNMAPDLPLILRSCRFKDVNFTCSSDASHALIEHLKNEYHKYILQAAIFHEALNCLCSPEDNSVEIEKKRGRIPLMLRQTEPSYEERRVKLEMKLAV